MDETDVAARLAEALREVALTVVQQRSPASLTSVTGTLTDRSIAALLPVVREIADQRAAEEAERLRDFAVEMINHPDDSAADWGYDLAHRLGMLDAGGTDA